MQKRTILLLLLTSLLLAVLASWTASPLSGLAAPMPLAPTPLATVPGTQVAPTAPPLSLTLTLAFTCCALGAVVGVIVLGFVLSLERRKDQQAEKQP